ncbi:DUF4299 domain-containing protein [Ruminococcaceae bacterium OttesenSCG-928-A11]|nr:DUF4299 domain-containing protein [Ruminococcaceae bacterium OttesenSCG-928-A11]
MSYSLTIRQKSTLFRTRLDLDTLRKHFGATYHIGSARTFFTYSDAPPTPGPAGEVTYMVYGGGSQLGRGFFVVCDQADTYEVTTPLPTTNHDLENLFAFAEALAALLDVRELEADHGRTVPRAGLAALFAEVRGQNAEVLRTFATTQKEPVVSGVRMPFYLTEALCRRIASVPPASGELYLSSYLAEKQALVNGWLSPVFAQNAQGENTGTYTLIEDTPSVIPKEPFVPAGVAQPFGGAPVQRWQLVLAPRNGPPLGTVPYTELTAFLEDHDLLKAFDERHWLIRGLSLKRMTDLANGPAT